MFKLLWGLFKLILILAFWPLFAVLFLVKGLFFIGLFLIGSWIVLGLFGMLSRRMEYRRYRRYRGYRGFI